MIGVIEETATRILEQTPGAVVRHHLLRDVLGKASNSPELQQAKDDLKHSLCVQELADEQWADGGCGRYRLNRCSLYPIPGLTGSWQTSNMSANERLAERSSALASPLHIIEKGLDGNWQDLVSAHLPASTNPRYLRQS